MSTLYAIQDSIAVITLNNPPVNGLGQSTRAGIVAGIEQANENASVIAIVIIGGGNVFCGGADIKEFGTDQAWAAPHLNTVIATLEQSGKPVTAAIHGVAMGGGLELALGCHYRVVTPGVQIAFPEVNIGIVPGGGGTQRMPRVVGVETALQMITSGVSVMSEKLFKAPGQKLFDRLFEVSNAQDLLAAAVAFAKETASITPLPVVKLLPTAAPQDPELFNQTRAALAKSRRNLESPQRCVDCVEAATRLDFEAGMAYEGDVFQKLLISDQAQAMRHAFFGERTASKIPDVPSDTPLRPIKQVAVIGSGTMGGGIATCFINAGVPVILLEMKQEAMDRGVSNIRKTYEAQVTKGKLTQDKLDARMALLTTTLNYDDIAQADMVIEAVFEDMAVKSQVFQKLDSIMKPGAILASNTSTLDVDKIAEITQRPGDVVGLHFFSPANVMRLLEVVRSKHTAKDVMATVMAVAKKIKKIAVVSGVCDGFIGNRMFEMYIKQAYALVEEGATPQQVDQALEAFGCAMGPFRVIDLAGNDIGWAIRKRRVAENPAERYSPIPDKVCEMGRFGQKVGKGWYDYEAGKREPMPSTEVQAAIEATRSQLGITPRTISDEEIVGRLILALVNEGARILDEGIANRASDIDMVYLNGYGFPVFRGGPMLYADMQGLPKVIAQMKAFQQSARDDAAFWEPAALLVKLAAEGKRFT